MRDHDLLLNGETIETIGCGTTTTIKRECCLLVLNSVGSTTYIAVDTLAEATNGVRTFSCGKDRVEKK